jgi:hypothetical protein
MLGSSNITKIVYELGCKLEAKVDLNLETVIKFEILRQLHNHFEKSDDFSERTYHS